MLFHIGEAFTKENMPNSGRNWSLPLPHKLCIRLTTRNKSSLSLSHITTPQFFPEFCYFLFVEEAMQEYLPNGTAVVENSNEH